MAAVSDELTSAEFAAAAMAVIAETLRTGTTQIFEYDMTVVEGDRSFEARLSRHHRT